MKQQNPLQTFIAYSRNDIDYLQEIKKSLIDFERENQIKTWYDGEIVAGTYWNEAITEKLEKADIILLLVSRNALYSNYFHEKEMKKALALHQKEVLIIPIILETCRWKKKLGNIQALPKDGLPIIKWQHESDAYVNIAEGIEDILPLARDLRAERTKREEKERNDEILILKRQLAEKEEELKRVLKENERLEYEIIILEDDKLNLSLQVIEKDGKYGFVDRNGNVVIDFIYDELEDFIDGLVKAKKNNKWGFIDKTGKVVIDFIYDDPCPFSEGLVNLEKDGKHGFVDRNGNIVIDFIYDFAWYFSEGLASVQKDGKYGFIDKTGKVIIDFIYDDGSFFEEGLAEIEKDGEWFYINKKGERVKKI